MVKITIQKEVFQKIPDLKIAFFHLTNADNQKNIKESKILIEETAQLVRLLYHKDSIRTHHLISPWELARLDMKKKMVPMHSAVEHFFSMALHSQKVSINSSAENILRHILFRHIVPGSTDDLDKIQGDITFKLAKKNQKLSWFTQLSKNDLIYKDQSNTNPYIGAKLDFAKSPRTRTSKYSKNILLHLDFLPIISPSKQRQIITETKNLLEAFTDAKVRTAILTQNKNTHSF